MTSDPKTQYPFMIRQEWEMNEADPSFYDNLSLVGSLYERYRDQYFETNRFRKRSRFNVILNNKL